MARALRRNSTFRAGPSADSLISIHDGTITAGSAPDAIRLLMFRAQMLSGRDLVRVIAAQVSIARLAGRRLPVALKGRYLRAHFAVRPLVRRAARPRCTLAGALAAEVDMHD